MILSHAALLLASANSVKNKQSVFKVCIEVNIKGKQEIKCNKQLKYAEENVLPSPVAKIPTGLW